MKKPAAEIARLEQAAGQAVRWYVYNQLSSTSELTKNKARLTLPFTFLFFVTVFAHAQTPEGSIRGTVLADDGSPVANAHVYAEVMRGSKILTVLNTKADDLGIFAVSQLGIGEYRIYADKQEDGYLSTRPDIFTPDPFLVVALSPGSPTATTVIHFGPKAAIITGWVRDSATGKSIAARLSLAPADRHAWSTTGTAGRFRFRLAIPADTPVNFGACAEGYKPWFYADPSDPSRPAALELESATKLKIDINLEHTDGKLQLPCLSGKY